MFKIELKHCFSFYKTSLSKIFSIKASIRDFNNKLITINETNIDLVDFLNKISETYEVYFLVNLKCPILLNSISFENVNLETIINYICEAFDLNYSYKDGIIYINFNNLYWKSYSLKFFFEDDLPNLSSFFDESKEYKGNQSVFWTEIEKNIKEISNNKFSIDKYNGIVNIFGNKNTHLEIENYLKTISKNLYQQVLIECKVVEISSEVNQSIDLQPILSSIQNIYVNHSITQCVQKFIEECQKIYLNIQIKTSTDIHMLLMSQHTGRILSSKIDFFSEYEYSQNQNNEKIYNNKVLSSYKKNEHGFSLSVVPLILDDKNILLKLRPSLSIPQKENMNNMKEPQNIQRREFNTVIRTTSEKNHILGGLYIEYECEENAKVSKNFILRNIFNKKHKLKKKSYFVLFIKVTIC